MVKQVIQNPFRILGVYANSAMKDIVANEGKMKAFLKVGRDVSYPLDLPSILPAIERSEAIVANAKSKIALPDDKFKHAQFWFVKGSEEDEEAFKCLFSGEIDKAIELWSHDNNAASYQNRMICYLIKEDLENALQMACILYEPMDAGYFTLVNIFCMELLKLVLGEDNSVNASGVDEHLFDALVKHYGSDVILKKMPDGLLKDQLVESISKNIISEISKHVKSLSDNKKGGATASLNAGRQLITSTKPLLIELKKLIPQTNDQYQIIADKLSLAILQCGIDYYNGSDDDNAATNAMSLQKYALSIAVGSLAKERCQENVNILQKNIDNLPPKEVAVEAKAINKELEKFCNLPDEISHSVNLLNAAKPHLQAIKAKLGASNTFYLKISTQVVGNALHNVIEEVNRAQRGFSAYIKAIKDSGIDPQLLNLLNDENSPVRVIESKVKPPLRAAWKAITLMDSFDMESEFKVNRYNPNKSSLKRMCSDLGISTYGSTSSTSSTRTTTRTSSSASTSRAYGSSSGSTPRSNSSSGSDDTNWGCIIAVIIGIIIFLANMCN